MRTEYTIKITDAKGNVHTSVYAKKYAEEEAKKAKAWYEPKCMKVEFFKVIWNGSSFYKAEKIW